MAAAAIPIATSLVGAWGAKKIAGDPPKAPAPIDAAAAAKAQGEANIKAAQIGTQLSRPDQTTPYGTLKWSQTGGSGYDSDSFENAWKSWNEAGGTGEAPTKASFGYDPNAWSSTMELNPESQNLLTSARTNAGSTLNSPIGMPNTLDLGQANAAARANYNDFSGQNIEAAGLASQGRGGTSSALGRLGQLNAESGPQANEEARKAIEQALYSRSTARLDPRFNQEGDKLNTALANQGLTQGSEAYNREMQNFSMGKNDAYSSAMNDAISNSTTEMQKLHGMELATRGQNAQIAQALGNLGLGASHEGLNWQKAMDAQEGMMDTSALNRIGVLTAKNQDQFNNQLAARDQTLQELTGVTAATRPSFESSGGTGVGASPILDALMAQQAGQTNNYNVDAAGYNADKAATAQMIQQAMAAAAAKKQADDAAKAAGNV